MAEANDRADRKGPRSTKKTTSSTVVSDDAVTTAATAVADPPPKPTRKKRVPKVRRKGPKSAEQLAEMEILDVWLLYREYHCEIIRNFLIEKYYDIVRYTAERMHMRLPNEVEVEDLMSAGLFGLMDAIDAFDTERGVKFETYCGTRIKGANFDELRAMDWVRAGSCPQLEGRPGPTRARGFWSEATDDEISAHMNLDKAEFKKVNRDAQPVGVVGLNRKWYETDSSKDVREIDVIKDKKQENHSRPCNDRTSRG